VASGETADARIPPMPAAVFAPGVVRPAEIDGMPSAWFARMLEKPVRQWISPASGLTPEDAAGLKAGFDELLVSGAHRGDFRPLVVRRKWPQHRCNEKSSRPRRLKRCWEYRITG